MDPGGIADGHQTGHGLEETASHVRTAVMEKDVHGCRLLSNYIGYLHLGRYWSHGIELRFIPIICLRVCYSSEYLNNAY